MGPRLWYQAEAWQKWDFYNSSYQCKNADVLIIKDKHWLHNTPNRIHHLTQ